MASNGPLAGVRVLEFGGIGPGPFAAMLLGDMGADVVRIDRPNAPHETMLARGKRSIALNMKAPDDKRMAEELAQQADILIEGFRPGVMERLGFGPEGMLKTNPKLVYGRMTGWGQHGPLAQAAGHDLNYIALSGALHAIGPKDGPPVPPLNLVGDFGGGSLYLVMGLLAALTHARATGEGQIVDDAMTAGRMQGNPISSTAQRPFTAATNVPTTNGCRSQLSNRNSGLNCVSACPYPTRCLTRSMINAAGRK